MDPFAKALQANSKTRPQYKAPALSPELEKDFNASTAQTGAGLNPFSEALARVGGNKFGDLGNFNQNLSTEDQAKQAQELEKQRKKEALRQKLHKEIHEVDLSQLYSAQEAKTLKMLEEVRQDLQVFAAELTQLYHYKDVDVALFQQVVKPGTTGIGLKAYFEKFRAFIRLLRQKVHSAKTWLNTQSTKSSKKRAHGQRGIEISGQSHEQTKAVFDQMHHEQSTAYSGS